MDQHALASPSKGTSEHGADGVQLSSLPPSVPAASDVARVALAPPPPSSDRSAVPPASGSRQSALGALGGFCGAEGDLRKANALTVAAAPAPAQKTPVPTEQQLQLMKAVMRGDVEAVRTQFNHVDWNFVAPVVGRTGPQSPLALLLRPELYYGKLCSISSADQLMLVQHALSLDRAFTPRLDSLNHASPAFRQTMSMHVIQAVYGGRVKLVQLLYDESLERARQGTGVAFNLRDVFFPSKITLLHMAAHDGQVDMCRWLLSRWDEERDRDPTNPLNALFTAEVLDGAGQTPLFWTFARGNVSVELARFFVDERGCDLFRVVPLHSKVPQLDADGAVVNDAQGNAVLVDQLDGYASAFSLAIQLAPDFVEEQLRSKMVTMGCRFQMQVMKFSFEGITLRTEQVQRIQAHVDLINEEESIILEGNAFLKLAKDKLEKQLFEADAKLETQETHPISSALSTVAPAPSSSALSPSSSSTAASRSSSLARLSSADVEELRFLSQEPCGTRPPKERWDTFFYNATPLSALELMVLHRRRRMLLTPIMGEIRQRLWEQLIWEYYCLCAGFITFGLLFAVNTALWPRTVDLIRRTDSSGSSTSTFRPPPSLSDLSWLAQYFVCNVVCALLSLVLLVFYAKVVSEGPHRRPSSLHLRTVKASAMTLVRNMRVAFHTNSARIDVAIIVCFWLVEAVQWSLICHVPQFATQSVCGAPSALVPAHVSALSWLSVCLHLLLGAKLLELLSVVNWAGPLFSTLVGMARDVGRFLALFCVGFAAFACAGWIVLKDQFGPLFDASLGLDAPAASATLGDDGAPSFSYGDALLTQLLWVFLSFDFSGLSRTPVSGVSALGQLLFLSFLLVLVLVMLNVMIAMFSNTYADVVKESEGEAALTRTALIVQLMQLAGGTRSKDAQRFIAGMGVENNCGIDRPTVADSSGAINAETNAAIAAGVQTSRDGSGNWAETVNEHFMQLAQQMTRMRAEMAHLKAQVAEANNEQKKMAAAQAGANTGEDNTH